MDFDLWTNGVETIVARSATEALKTSEVYNGTTATDEGWEESDWGVRNFDLVLATFSPSRSMVSVSEWIEWALSQKSDASILCSAEW